MPSKIQQTLLEGLRECYDLVSEWIYQQRCVCGRDSHVTIM